MICKLLCWCLFHVQSLILESFHFARCARWGENGHFGAYRRCVGKESSRTLEMGEDFAGAHTLRLTLKIAPPRCQRPLRNAVEEGCRVDLTDLLSRCFFFLPFCVRRPHVRAKWKLSKISDNTPGVSFFCPKRMLLRAKKKNKTKPISAFFFAPFAKHRWQIIFLLVVEETEGGKERVRSDPCLGKLFLRERETPPPPPAPRHVSEQVARRAQAHLPSSPGRRRGNGGLCDGAP